MGKNHTLIATNKREQWIRFGLAFMLIAAFASFAIVSGMAPAFAAADVLDNVMNTIIGIISDAAFFIGLAIVLWGAFQIVLAFRREDSEGISKQITSVVVGGVLVGFGAVADELYASLNAGRNSGGNSGT